LKTKKTYRRGVKIAGSGEKPEKNQGLSGELKWTGNLDEMRLGEIGE
jgi:hypothetical protein